MTDKYTITTRIISDGELYYPKVFVETLLTQIAQDVRQEPTINGTLLKLNVLSILSRHGATVSEENV